VKTVTWYVTFGFGGMWGGHYTEILVRSDAQPDQEMAARMAAFAYYGTEWAFIYAPEHYQQSIAKYGMKRREVISA
jgi:hypothetical protein